MKLTIPKEKLLKAVQISESIISAKTPISILSNILLEADNNTLTVSSTNLEIAIKSTVEAHNIVPGAITVHGKKFGDIIKELPDDDIEIWVDDEKNVFIKSKNQEIQAEFKVKGIPKTDFPALPEVSTEKEVKIPQSVLKNLIRKTIFAVSLEDTQTYLNGINIEIENKKIKFVATDGSRLAFAQAKIEADITEEGVIVPYKVFAEVLKILSEEGMATIKIGENQIYFKIGNVEIISRLIDGKFPDYQRVIPENFSKVVVLFTEKVLNAVRRVSLIPMKKTLIKVVFKFSKNKLRIWTSDPEIGEGKEDLEITYDYEDFEIAFSSNFIIDALKAIDTDQFYIKMNTNETAVMVNEINNEDFFCLIMPLRLSDAI